MNLSENTTSKRRRKLAVDIAFRPRYFELRPLLNAVVAMAVFYFSLRIVTGLLMKNPALYFPWLDQQSNGMSLYEQLVMINVFFGIYAALDIASAVQMNRINFLQGINYGVMALGVFLLFHYALYLGEMRTQIGSLTLGPWTNFPRIEVDYPQIRNYQDVQYSSCWPEGGVLLSTDGNRLIIGNDVSNPIEMKKGRLVSRNATPGRIGPWIPEIGERLFQEYRQWKTLQLQTGYIKYRIVPPEVDSGFEIWPKKGVADLIIKADRKMPFETIELILMSAGESGFNKWCLWNNEFETQWVPLTMELPKFAVLDGTEKASSRLDLRIYLKSDSLSLSFNSVPDSTRERLEFAGEDQLKKLQSHLKHLKESWREEVMCLVEVEPNVTFEKVVNLVAAASGTEEYRLFPYVLFIKKMGKKPF